jgi:hypothetical protein
LRLIIKIGWWELMRLLFARGMLLDGEKKKCFDAGQRSVEMQIWMEKED